MSLATFLQHRLQEEFAFGFTASDVNRDQSALISIDTEDANLFDVSVLIKEDIRLKISVHPQRNGGFLMGLIHKSKTIQREKFVQLWSQLPQKACSLRINEYLVNPQDFIEYSEYPHKFTFDFSLAPYCDEEEAEEEKMDTVANYTVIIFRMMLSLLSYDIVGQEEGNSYYQVSKRYERNPINRQLCLKLKGFKCSVCGFDFEKVYGDIGREYIEIHHSLPVSEMGPNHKVIPEKELFPLCANCHRMVHRKNPPYTIDELKAIVNGVRHNEKEIDDNTEPTCQVVNG